MFNNISILNQTYKFHFIGIGGIGMSGLAKILLTKGFSVSGSDTKKSVLTDELIKLGAKIYFGHSKDNLANANVVVYSAAIKSDNCEFEEAINRKVILIPRSELLNEISSFSISIAVSGMHGKTTTSSILSKIFLDNSFDPTILLGGIAPFIKSNSYCGRGNYTIYEACEAYGALYSYNPTFIIVTNIELEHLDYFNNLDHILKEFNDFINRIPFYGKLFINGDDKNLIQLTRLYRKPLFSFGIENLNLTLSAKDIKYNTTSTSFDLIFNNKNIGKINSPLYGKHNVYNVLAAISVSLSLGINFEFVSQSIKNFVNSERRLQYIGQTKTVKVFSDYAHHPTEISATLDSIRQLDPKARVITIFQPHLYSRTKQFVKEFANSLEKSDLVYLLPIYPARELPMQGVSSENIEKLLKDKKIKTSCFSSDEELLIHLKGFEFNRDIILLVGAGDIHDFATKVLEVIG